MVAINLDVDLIKSMITPLELEPDLGAYEFRYTQFSKLSFSKKVRWPSLLLKVYKPSNTRFTLLGRSELAARFEANKPFRRRATIKRPKFCSI